MSCPKCTHIAHLKRISPDFKGEKRKKFEWTLLTLLKEEHLEKNLEKTILGRRKIWKGFFIIK